MKSEALDWLKPRSGSWILDATFGLGGHTAAILETGAKVLALDFDQRAILAGEARFAQEIAADKLILKRENFARISEILTELKQTQPDFKLTGALFDFGTSIEQLKYDDRGLSFNQPDQALDMRLDDRLGVTAKDLLMALPEKHLMKLFSEYGGEVHAKKLAKVVVIERTRHPEKLATVGGFLSITGKVLPPRHGHLNPATKVFQALRIAVNDELTSINTGLRGVLKHLEIGGKIVTIAFHEGEDSIVKDWFKDCEAQGRGEILTKKSIPPSESELAINPRSRSARLRVIAKLT